jgi:hypothetical protein
MKNFKWISIVVFVAIHTAVAQTASEDMTSLEPYFSESLSGHYSQQIIQMVSASSCVRYSWKSRRVAPRGYVKGIALGFARSLCRLRANTRNNAARIMSRANTGNAAEDALAHYESVFAARRISINQAGESAMRALYVLGLGLGMRESSGHYCEGWDTAAGSHRPSSTGEAGLFQVSYDSIETDPALQQLYSEYRANPNRCMLDIFKEGVECHPQRILGTGAGAEFQKINKACPAFATEYAMVLLRLSRSHFGPINRREAEVKAACNQMLTNVQQLVDADPRGVCQELY